MAFRKEFQTDGAKKIKFTSSPTVKVLLLSATFSTSSQLIIFLCQVSLSKIRVIGSPH